QTPVLGGLILRFAILSTLGTVLLAPLIQAPGTDSQAGCNIRDFVAAFCRLAHGLDLEFLGKAFLHGLRTHDESSTPHYEAYGYLEVPGRFKALGKEPATGASCYRAGVASRTRRRSYTSRIIRSEECSVASITSSWPEASVMFD